MKTERYQVRLMVTVSVEATDQYDAKRKAEDAVGSHLSNHSTRKLPHGAVTEWVEATKVKRMPT
jgi:hypothetical protein